MEGCTEANDLETNVIETVASTAPANIVDAKNGDETSASNITRQTVDENVTLNTDYNSKETSNICQDKTLHDVISSNEQLHNFDKNLLSISNRLPIRRHSTTYRSIHPADRDSNDGALGESAPAVIHSVAPIPPPRTADVTHPKSPVSLKARPQSFIKLWPAAAPGFSPIETKQTYSHRTQSEKSFASTTSSFESLEIEVPQLFRIPSNMETTREERRHRLMKKLSQVDAKKFGSLNNVSTVQRKSLDALYDVTVSRTNECNALNESYTEASLAQSVSTKKHSQSEHDLMSLSSHPASATTTIEGGRGHTCVHKKGFTGKSTLPR